MDFSRKNFSLIMLRQLLALAIFLVSSLTVGAISAIGQTPTADQIGGNIGNTDVFDRRRDPTPNGASNIAYERRGLSTDISDGEFRKRILKSQAETKLRVYKIYDGNTIQVGNSTGRQWVRILGVDAPEIGQAGGEQARIELAKLLDGKIVTLKYSTYRADDVDGVFLARVFLAETDIGLSLIEKGRAWFDDAYKYFFSKADATANARAQKLAVQAKLGIWSDDDKPQPPWEFRERKLEELKRERKKNR
jgi:micrococcal nuclease